MKLKKEKVILWYLLIGIVIAIFNTVNVVVNYGIDVYGGIVNLILQTLALVSIYPVMLIGTFTEITTNNVMVLYVGAILGAFGIYYFIKNWREL